MLIQADMSQWGLDFASTYGEGIFVASSATSPWMCACRAFAFSEDVKRDG